MSAASWSLRSPSCALDCVGSVLSSEDQERAVSTVEIQEVSRRCCPVTQGAAAHLVSNAAQFLLDSWCPMEYKRAVQTVVETPTYLAIAKKLFSEEERADIVALVAADPECGDVIRGTGGFRKVRVARKGMGKSGGARVVYIWRNERFPVFLITVFPKNEKENLSMAERNALRKRADSIFETYGR